MRWFLLLLAVHAATATEGRHRPVVAPPAPIESSDYLRAAEETAAWLASVEIRNGDRSAWPVSLAYPGAGPANIGSGAAGIGFFYLRLATVTHDASHLDTARRAANYVIAQTRTTPPITAFDWLGGAAGSGAFLVAMHRATGDVAFRNAAVRIADALLTTARTDGGLHWQGSDATKTYTGIAHGAAGVGMFLLDVYEMTRDSRYLDGAERAFDWMMQYTIAAPQGFVWKRLTADVDPYPGWCGGSSGILLFIARLAAITGDERHTRAMTDTADGLVSTAVPQREGELAWWHYGVGTSFGIIYCHGAASVAVALNEACARSGDRRYCDAAGGAMNWIHRLGRNEPVGRSWNHFNAAVTSHYTGLMIGTASIGHVSLRLYRTTRDEVLLQQARDAAAYLIATAEHPAPGQSHWINYTNAPFPDDDPKTYETGWYTGAAGIGLFFLELHDATYGRFSDDIFSGSNP